MANYMFDTSVFSTVTEKYLDVLEKSSLKHEYFATDIQHDEIKGTADGEKRNRMLKCFSSIPPNTSGDAPLAQSSVPILSLLDQAGEKPENRHDALIITACMRNKYTLVTENRLAGETAWKYGSRVNNLYEFLKAVNGITQK
jgi:hypothetical protein